MSGDLLKITEGNAAGGQIELEDELVIGRTADGPGTLANDPQLSRRHARIVRENGTLVLEDLGSTNGTFLNGKRIDGPSPLRDGDKIELGSTTLEVARSQEDQATEVVQRPGVRATEVRRTADVDSDATSTRAVLAADGAPASVEAPAARIGEPVAPQRDPFPRYAAGPGLPQAPGPPGGGRPRARGGPPGRWSRSCCSSWAAVWSR